MRRRARAKRLQASQTQLVAVPEPRTGSVMGTPVRHAPSLFITSKGENQQPSSWWWEQQHGKPGCAHTTKEGAPRQRVDVLDVQLGTAHDDGGYSSTAATRGAAGGREELVRFGIAIRLPFSRGAPWEVPHGDVGSRLDLAVAGRVSYWCAPCRRTA